MNETTVDQATPYAFTQKNKSGTGIFMFCRPISEVNTLVTVYSVLIFVIIVSNSIIIITFAKNRKIRTVTNCFFASLAVSDILVGTVSIPMWIHMIVFPLRNNCGLPGPIFLEVYRFLDIFSAISSTAHLMAISFERSLAITRPLRHRACPRNFFYALLVVAWFYGLITSVLIVSNISEQWIKYRAIAVFVAGFCFPFLTIIILYTMTYRSVKSYVKRRRSNSAGNIQKYIHREKRTAMTVGIVLGVFILAWLPFFIVSLVATFCIPCRRTIMGFSPAVNFVKILHYTNSAVNPFIYTFRNSIWKRAFLKAVLPCIKMADEKARVHWKPKSSDFSKKYNNCPSSERKSRNSTDLEVKTSDFGKNSFLSAQKPKKL